MRAFHRFAGQGSIQLALALVAVGSWLSGCGDDEKSGGGGKGGSSGTAGAAGSVTGGNAGSATGGNGGSSAGSGGNAGSGGSTVAGSGGSTAGNAGAAGAAGSAGSAGMGGEPGGGGEGGIGDGGMAGTAGIGGEGGTPDSMCTTGNLSFDDITMPAQQHDHLPVNGMSRTTFLGMINTGMPLAFTLPQDGTNPHTHTLTFTAAQLTTLRNGGTIATITSSMGGPAMNMHTHTYSIECAP